MEDISAEDWKPGMPVPDGYGIQINEDETQELVESWPTSPGSEPVEDDEDDEDGTTDIAVLCEECYENGNFGTMWPGGDHDDGPTWGVAAIVATDGDWDVTWSVTGLTVAQAQAYLDGTYSPGPVHLMG